MTEQVTERRRTFVPVVGGGLAAGILLAVACARPWVVAEPDVGDPFDTVADAGEMPLAAALSLVVLACWGVVLLTRGRVRRATAGLGLVAALGTVVTVVVGRVTLPDAVVEAATEVGLGRTDAVTTGTTGWFWLAAATSLLCVAATALAVAWSPAWPEMGSRYDAPGGDREPDPPPEDRSSLDIWKSMDEGRDPTA